jgi:Protein kinase domain
MGVAAPFGYAEGSTDLASGSLPAVRVSATMIGKQLGGWTIERELGRGGMGTVYLARRQAAGVPGPAQDAALKVLAPELAKESGFLHRFQREIDALARLDHPNIVHFYEAGTDDNIYFYAMEYVVGQTFEELLQERGRFPWREVVEMAMQVCPALKHAHDHGVIHRDLKPQNLMRTESGVIKLTDFGIAKIFAAKQLTSTGGLVGTADYLSPEQASGKTVTNRSDLYSFGVVLYVMLTGRTPFRGVNVLDLLHKHLFSQFDRPQKIVPEIPYELDELVCSLMAKEPGQRPANGHVVQRRLQSVLNRHELRTEKTLADAGRNRTRVEGLGTESPEGDEPGAGTLTARLMREELLEQQRQGPIARMLNQAWVLVILLVLCVGVIVWRLWPQSKPDRQQLFEKGSELMASADPAKWDQAWNDYLQPLVDSNPKFKHDEIARFRTQKQLGDQLLRTLATRGSDPSSEAQGFFLQGLASCQEGEVTKARAKWRAVVGAYAGVPAEEQWVRLAQAGLERLGDDPRPEAERHASANAALQQARTMRDQGKTAQAEAIWKSLEELYRGDPDGATVLAQVRKDRQAKPAG